MKRYCNNSLRSADKRLIIATHNRNKFFEIRLALGPLRCELCSLQDFAAAPEAPETGSSFAENARQKARFYFEHLKNPVIAEDSGLVVPALNGYPGIYSARIASDDARRIALVLEKLRGRTDRSACYVCSMVFQSANTIQEVEGICQGTITKEPSGNQGFSYDPIFKPEESSRTFGEMTMKEKTNYSHRAKAARKLLELLEINNISLDPL